MTYNPMSKEFQDECKRLGLTGYQLRQKYERQGKSFEKGIYIHGNTRKDNYNDTNTCNKCGINFKEVVGHPYREWNKEEGLTGKWICNSCYRKYRRINDPGCLDNIKKLLRGCRTGFLDPNSNHGKGNNFQELTCKWRSTISTIPVEDLNKKYDNYETSIDHSCDTELGIIQTTGRRYDSRNGYWGFTMLDRECQKVFDVEICYCASEDGKDIERLYIFPKEQIILRSSIAIVKYNSIGQLYKYGWYEKYRVTDEETIKKVNEIWKKIIGKK